MANVLSLFDGISCGRVALARAGIPVARYFASEIDKHATAIARARWPDTVHLGDVCGVQPEDLPSIDLLFAGSPCQGFSNNGTGDGFEHKQSKLFWEFIRLLRALKPTYFLLENVRMKQQWQDIISREVGCEPVAINSSLLSAQSRPRLYWTNLPSAGVPKDKGLTIFDILELPASPSQPMITKAQKAYCLTATHGNCLGKDGKPIPSEIAHNTKRHQRTCIKVIGRVNRNGFATAEKVHSPTGLAPCVQTRYPPKVGERVFSSTAVSKPSKHSGVAKLPVMEEGSWRMLTPVECERLQTLPDNYTSQLSDRQRYRALGNGWTVDVVAHLLSTHPRAVKRKRLRVVNSLSE